MHNNSASTFSTPPSKKKKINTLFFFLIRISYLPNNRKALPLRGTAPLGYRLLAESSSPQHATPGRACLRRKPKVSHLSSLTCRQHSYICAVKMSALCCWCHLIYMHFPSPEVFKSWCEVVKQALGCRTGCACRALSHHGEETSLSVASQILCWWRLCCHWAQLWHLNTVVCI